MTSALFRPLALRGLTLPNRIVISPMCQFSAIDGCATDWHLIHLGHLALSGAGLLMIEATAVTPDGRITRECLGLYGDAQEQALRRVLETVRRYSAMPVGIQLNHAGRKASQYRPSDGRGPLSDADGGWPCVAPSALAFMDGWQTPRALGRSDLAAIVAAYEHAARRCARLPIDLVEVHAAHGYLLSSFLSPLANRRTDEYGGSLENRMRFPLAVIAAVRAAWPADRPLAVRCNATDWDERGLSPTESIAFARELRRLGCDLVDVSSGGNGIAQIPIAPGYQVPFAAAIRREAGVATMAVGLIRDPTHAARIVEQGEADLVAIGRGFMNDPRWPWHAAEELGVPLEVPVPYRRAATRAGIDPHYALARSGQGDAPVR